MSVFEDSNCDPRILPVARKIGLPEATVAENVPPPSTRAKPASALNEASAICEMSTVWLFVKVTVTRPPSLIATLWNEPALDPLGVAETAAVPSFSN